MHEKLKATEVVERIFDASTLEEAIFWRQTMVRRLVEVLTAEGTNLSPDERDLYRQAKAQTEMAISRLQLALAKGERWLWGDLGKGLQHGRQQLL